MSSQIAEENSSITIGEIASIARGTINPNLSPNEEFTYYSIPGYDATGGALLTQGREIQSNKTLLQNECILISKLNPRIPRVCLASISERNRTICSTEFIPLVPKNESVSPEYLTHYFRSPAFQERFQAAAGGSTNSHSRVTPGEILDWEVFIPPLPEQKKIAEILSGIGNTIEMLKKKKAKHQSLLQSMRQEIFNEESANTCRFDQVVWERMLGTTRRGVGNGASIPLVKMGDITRGDVKLGENERIQDGDDLDELLLQRGDILFNTRNTPALVGKTAIYDSDERCTYDNNLMRIRVAPSNDPWYLNHLMNSPQFLQLLTRITAGTTSVAAIYWNDLRRVEIPLPPITRQKQIAKSIQSVLSVIYDLSTEIYCLEELRNALSSDLLSGRKRVSV